MNFGSHFTPVSFFTPAVPPFPAGAANNGLSVDPVTGLIVLGNDVGDATEPARLLNDREIVTDDSLGNFFGLNLNSINYGINTVLNGQFISILGGNNTLPFIRTQAGDNSLAVNSVLTGDGAQSQIIAQSGDFGIAGFDADSGNTGFSYLHIGSTDFANELWIKADGSGFINFSVNGGFGLDFMRTDVNTLNTQFSNNSMQAFNGATLQVTGTLTHQTETTGFTGARNVDRDIDSSRLFYNNGAAGTLTLPNMAAANFREGFNMRFACNHASGITIQASAGQTVRVGTSATSVAGTLSSTAVGSYGRITLIDSTTWVVEYVTGSWTIT
jgi:hypothetical protein